MKHIINYLGALLAVALIGATFAACSDDDDNGSPNVGLGIKVFFPTKVVANQPITINGTGFADVTEVEFPGGLKVTDFELVSNSMIRVNAPSGLPAEGGKIVVHTANEQTESRLPLTIGHTAVKGFQLPENEGGGIIGGDLITVYGTDLEFINSVELLDAEGNPQIIDHKDFYRKGTSNLIFRVPSQNIFKGTFVGYLHTFDGQKIAMPELAYEPAATGHWETVITSFWKNDGSRGTIDWGNVNYRFGMDGADGNNECIATFPADVWEKIKTGTFFAKFSIDADWYQIRITTGWWSTQWLGSDNDISPNNMTDRIIDNGDGTCHIEINFEGDPILDVLDQQHLLFTGSGYTLLELYLAEEIWVENGSGKPSEYDIAPFTLYQDQRGNLEYPYYPSWNNDLGKLRIMRGLGDPALETLGLTTSSKFVIYKEAGTTGQLQWNNANWNTFAGVDCSDWDGSAETLEVPVTEDMLKCINGEVVDGWSNTAIILQGDGLTITKIVIVP